MRVLRDVGYYRLSAYFLTFKQEDGKYKSGTKFDNIYRIYEFDRKLRSLLLSAIEKIEVYLRATLSYYHGGKYGALGYLNPNNFNSKHNAERFSETIQREIDNNKKVLFVKHHMDNYDGQFPIWVISELFTFGTLSYFYNDLITADKKALFASDFRNYESWLRCCTDLRNVCAHYGRLYYRIFPAIPAGFNLEEGAGRRLWGAILTIKALYPDKESWHSHFIPTIQALFDEYNDWIDLYHLAFPPDWLGQLKN